MERTKWVDKKFKVDNATEILPQVLLSLKKTILQINELTKNLSCEQLTRQFNNSWSIQEHIGHLSDLEDLHEGRIDDFIARKEVLRAADMKNVRTYNANHNSEDLKDLINDFTKKRELFISRLSTLDNETQKFASLHPRLQVMMRPVDMAHFTAEHDDHHLTTIKEIISKLEG